MGQAYNGADAIRTAAELAPDVVLMDIQLPDMDGLAAAEAIRRVRPVAVVMVTGHTEPEFLDRAKTSAYGYVVKPVSGGALPPAIETALARFREAQALVKEVGELKESLANRKIIERAKGFLIDRARMTEEQAYLTLQKAARSQNMRLVDLAKRVLDAGDVWRQVLTPGPRQP